MKICQCCKIPKEEDDFGNNKRYEDGKQRTCILCIRAQQLKSYNKDKKKYYTRVRKRAEVSKNYIKNKKKECKCLICNENREWLLDFHHNKGDKKYNIADLGSSGRSIELIEKEINKCVVLCSNCHRDFHHFEKEDNLTFKQYIKLRCIPSP